MSNPFASRLLTAKQVKEILACSLSMVYKLNREKKLVVTHIIFGQHKGMRWSVETVLDFLNHQENPELYSETFDGPDPPYIPIAKSRKTAAVKLPFSRPGQDSAEMRGPRINADPRNLSLIQAQRN